MPTESKAIQAIVNARGSEAKINMIQTSFAMAHLLNSAPTGSCIPPPPALQGLISGPDYLRHRPAEIPPSTEQLFKYAGWGGYVLLQCQFYPKL